MLKEARIHAGFSQNTLAEVTGISARTIQAWEQGTKNINGAKLKTLLTLSEALDCPLSSLLTDDTTIDLLYRVSL